MSSRDDRRDDDLEARLDELEGVLTELRRDLRETERDRRGPPRPPRLSELVRFTEQYTIPTVIALLETTIKSLELLRGTLRMADPGRELTDGAERTGDRLGDVRDGASAGVARSLSELRKALSEADLPEEAGSRSIIADARDLTAEIESRIEESRREGDGRSGRGRLDDGRENDGGRTADRRAGDSGSRKSSDDGGIRIDVTDPGAETDADTGEDAADAGHEDGPSPEVDVDSELESIKRQLDGDTDDEADPDATGDRDAGETRSGDDRSDGAGAEADDEGEVDDGAEADDDDDEPGDGR